MSCRLPPSYQMPPEIEREETPTAAPLLSSPSVTPPNPFDIEGFLFGMVQDVHNSNPDHPMFGPPIQGKLRLPLRAARKNGQSWYTAMKKIANRVVNVMGADKVTKDGCWMTRGAQLQITAPGANGGIQVLIQINTVRILAFLANPTDLNWDRVSGISGLRAIDSPFSHACGQGGPRQDQPDGTVCTNGVYHGRFAARDENESHKLCTNGARALCPGHGEPAVKCIFTNGDGSLQACRMIEDCVLACRCVLKCFG